MIPPAGARKEFLRLIGFSIGSQIVEHEQESYKILLGTGMGLIHSGDLSDLVFMLLFDRGWAADPQVQRKCSVRFFARFLPVNLRS